MEPYPFSLPFRVQINMPFNPSHPTLPRLTERTARCPKPKFGAFEVGRTVGRARNHPRRLLQHPLSVSLLPHMFLLVHAVLDHVSEGETMRKKGRCACAAGGLIWPVRSEVDSLLRRRLRFLLLQQLLRDPSMSDSMYVGLNLSKRLKLCLTSLLVWCRSSSVASSPRQLPHFPHRDPDGDLTAGHPGVGKVK